MLCSGRILHGDRLSYVVLQTGLSASEVLTVCGHCSHLFGGPTSAHNRRCYTLNCDKYNVDKERRVRNIDPETNKSLGFKVAANHCPLKPATFLDGIGNEYWAPLQDCSKNACYINAVVCIFVYQRNFVSQIFLSVNFH